MTRSMVQEFKLFKNIFALTTVLVSIAASTSAQSAPRAGRDWPGFRGIAARGVDDAKAVPVQWSVPESKLVKWRVPVAGLGHSSPVVWDDHVCTASAISGTPDPQLKVGLYGDIGSVLDQTEHKFIVSCFDKKTGKPRWERVAQVRRADGQAASEIDARQLHARDRRPLHRRDVRIGGAATPTT